jgi:hypothetical protein
MGECYYQKKKVENMEKTRKLTIICAAAAALAIGVAGVSFAGTTPTKPAEVEATQTSTTFSATTPLFKKVAYNATTSDTNVTLMAQHTYAAIKDDMAANSYDYVDSSNKTHRIVATAAGANFSSTTKADVTINPTGGLLSSTGGTGLGGFGLVLIGLRNVRSVTFSVTCSSDGTNYDSMATASFFSSEVASLIYTPEDVDGLSTYTFSCNSATYPEEPRWLVFSFQAQTNGSTITLTSLSVTWDQSC